MKKLFSAASSLVLAATMLTSAVSANAYFNKDGSTTGADPSKGLSLRTVNMETFESGSNDVKVTAEQLANGAVELTCGLYLEEATEAQIAGISVNFGLNPANCPTDGSSFVTVARAKGETGKTLVTAPFYNDEKEFTTSAGTAFITDCIPTALGSVEDGYYVPAYTNVEYNQETDTSLAGKGIDFPTLMFVGTLMNGSIWLGETSDEYPMCYFTVTIEPGAPEGDYVIGFNEYYNNDMKTHSSCQLGFASKQGAYYRNKEMIANSYLGELNLEPLTIHVGDSQPVVTTTTAATTKPPVVTTTTTDSTSQGEALLDFTYNYEKNGDGTQYVVSKEQAAAGYEFTAEMYLDSHGRAVSGMDIGLKATSPIEITGISSTSRAFSNYGLVTNYTGSGAEKAPMDKEGNLIAAQFAGAFMEEVEDPDDPTKVVRSPLVPKANRTLATFKINIPAGTPEGMYYIDPAYIDITSDSAGTNYAQSDINFARGIIKIGDSDTPATTTTTDSKPVVTTTTTTAKVPTTTTEPQPIEPGTRVLGDTNCDNKVNVADVVILNKFLAGKGDLMSDQGKINGEVTAPVTKVGDVDLTYDDSTAITQSIVHLVELTDDGVKHTQYYK